MFLLLGMAIGSIVVFALASRFVSPRYSDLVYYWVSDSNKILAFGLGITSFLFFKNLSIRHSEFINTVSATTFGVFLIHANGNYMRQFLWNDFFRNADFFASKWFVLHSILVVLSVFAVCSFIDYLRIRFIEKHLLNIAMIVYNKTIGRLRLFSDTVQ